MKYSCGTELDFCRCRYGQVPVQRTWAEVDAAHREAVARADRSGFAAQPLPLWLWQTYDPTAFTTTASRAA